jgi:rsbT co-antagonist protein RsbR
MHITAPTAIRRSFRLQLLAALSLLTLLAAAIAAVALGSLFMLRVDTRTSAADTTMSRLANEVGLRALLCRRYEKDFFLSAGDPSQQQAPVQQWHAESINLREAINAFEKAATSDADREFANTWRAAWQEYVRGFGRVELAISQAQIQSPQDAVTAFGPFQANIQTLTDQAVMLAHSKGISAEQTSVNLESSGIRASWIVMWIAALALVISVACSLLFPRWLMRPISALHAAAVRLSEGDLGARVALARQDELGELAQRFDVMAATLQRNTNDLQAQYAAANGARAAAEEAHDKIVEQLAMIEAQRAVISEMSVPILPLTNSTLVMPLVGALDSARLHQAQERAMKAIEALGARHLILDVTGVPIIDTLVAKGILQILQMARLLGCQLVLVGIRPEVAQALVGLGIELQGVATASTLQGGVVYTLRQGAAPRDAAALMT